jgi:hypothetical protein
VPLRGRLLEWLTGRDADPSVRLKVLEDVLGRPRSDAGVAAARAQLARKGWAAQVLARQHPDGRWESAAVSQRSLYRPKYVSTQWSLLALCDLGVSGTNPRVAKAVDLFLRTYESERAGLGFPSGEICFTGNALRMMARFGRLHDPRVQRCIDWIVRNQKSDGGWHCFPSKTGTLDGWEGMAAFAAIPEGERSPAVRRSIERGAEFYLKRGLLREGRGLYAPWLRLHFPNHYYYDLLVGLDFMTALRYGDDRRMQPPLDRLESMRNRDGSWNLDRLHPDSEDPNYPVRRSYYAMGFEVPGQPSRMVTARALAVLKRAGRL